MKTLAHVLISLTLVATLLSCGGGANIVPPPPRVTATPTTAPLGCTLGNGVQAAQCEVEKKVAIRFAAQVDDAIEAAIAEHPEMLDLTNEQDKGGRNYFVIDRPGFRRAVVKNLQEADFCAEVDVFSSRRIKVKNTADVHEDYNILTVDYGNGVFIQRAPESYDISCYPAAFPLVKNPDVPPPDQRCGQPYPPLINNIGIHVQLRDPVTHAWFLDSTPQIRNNAAYCAEVGYTDGRNFCPLRPEGNPERVPCEEWRIGVAKDTGVLGPTWTRDGVYCTGEESGCANVTNAYHLEVFESDGLEHVYQACPEEGGCGTLPVAH